jgi:hypothetical protein
MPRAALLLSVLVVAVGVAACGRDPAERFTLRTPPEHTSADPLPEVRAENERSRRIAAARPTKADAKAAKTLLSDWAAAVRHNHDHLAAGYFAPPVLVDQGALFRLETRSQVESFNASLQCGLEVLRVVPDGRFLVGTFRLAERTAHQCLTPGRSQRVAVAMQGGKIVEWREVHTGAQAEPGPAVPEDAPPQPPPHDA